MGTLRFFEEVVSFKIRRTFGFADYTTTNKFQIAPTIVGVFCLYTAHEQIDKSKPPPFIECKI